MESVGMSAGDLPLVASDLSTTLGALEIGLILSAVFYGITIIQTYTYYRYSEPDWWPVKLSVFAMWLLDTLHFAFLAQILYTYTVTDYASENAILDPTTWLTMAVSATQSLLDIVVRILYCYRIWRLNLRKLLLIVPILICSLANFAFGILFAVQERHFVSLILMSGGSKWILYAGTSLAIAADVLITASQVVLLWNQHAEFYRTRNIIRMLILYSIQTGVLVTLSATSCLMLFAFMPHNNLYIALYLLLPQLLLNSLLATLNAKHNLRASATGGIVELTMSDSAHTHSACSAGHISLARKGVRGDQRCGSTPRV
ncbi:hypothetical protein OBBRIDRAFT_396186 [Obba rivulosa]|uniref:DUF6534 domain-containing protein n=1 Tax=Obba rivulosa TaxID=1052685 RepID=A0A8E2APV0_9APHY|nr:hypothetical protein OBBRIDRAFT_396186 [Obba rivulosa]